MEDKRVKRFREMARNGWKQFSEEAQAIFPGMNPDLQYLPVHAGICPQNYYLIRTSFNMLQYRFLQTETLPQKHVSTAVEF